ncbi:MAG: F0F1 ATP synthase subunit epsilon [Prevotellaceae bacterium]|jgi:F-type H+-transporting ATPase subunit epsilon|nr:F0F1 ATP synthase subunit epsilon [Prevotellaceae bacterium]
MDSLHLHIISPEHKVFDGEVESITLPGTIGKFAMLPGHAPIVSSLVAGEMLYVPKEGGEVQTLAIDGGFVEQHNNEATVCVELSNSTSSPNEKKA